jgi:uncharacterized protein
MIIVSDTSPIINLAMIGQLHILPALFGKVVIPEKVFEEITLKGADMPGADEIKKATWVEVKACSNQELIQALSLQVDPGEAEAIALAMELPAQLPLIDERIGRQVAKGFHLPIMGLLGVLRIAKEKNLIPQIKPLLDQMIQLARFRISNELYEEILRLSGERPL